MQERCFTYTLQIAKAGVLLYLIQSHLNLVNSMMLLLLSGDYFSILALNASEKQLTLAPRQEISFYFNFVETVYWVKIIQHQYECFLNPQSYATYIRNRVHLVRLRLMFILYILHSRNTHAL